MSRWPRKIGLLLMGASILVLLGNSNSCQHQQVSSSGAEQVLSPTIPRNSRKLTVEQQNINDRIKATMDPTKVMWIHLIALDGKIVKRMPVRNKLTSSGKRLEPTKSTGTNGGFYPCSPFKRSSSDYFETDEFIQPDGTYGSSDPYIFWFDPQGRYHQWGTAGGLGYLLTDYPIDLQDPQDAITGMYNLDKSAHEWQQRQEVEMSVKEGKVKPEKR